MNAERLPLVLIAEDNNDDLFFFKRRLELGHVRNPVIEFGDGGEAVTFLQGFTGALRPEGYAELGVLFLDIKMPRMTGHDVLEWVRAQPRLGGLKVVMLSSSDDPTDLARAKELGADGYLIKYPSWQTLASIISGIETERHEPALRLAGRAG